MQGRCQLVRYADDALLLFESNRDGERVLDVLDKRLGKFGLTLNKTKTHYVDFRPQAGKGHGPTATFDFLGFTHAWAKSQAGRPVVRQITARSRFARGTKAVNDWCRRHRSKPLSHQQAYLASVIRGHCNYYGIRGNSGRLSAFRYQVRHIWRKWLSRRDRASRVSWAKMAAILKQYPLPTPRLRQT